MADALGVLSDAASSESAAAQALSSNDTEKLSAITRGQKSKLHNNGSPPTPSKQDADKELTSTCNLSSYVTQDLLHSNRSERAFTQQENRVFRILLQHAHDFQPTSGAPLMMQSGTAACAKWCR